MTALIKTCGCSIAFTAEGWKALPMAGFGEAYFVRCAGWLVDEFRHCSCRSTIAIQRTFEEVARELALGTKTGTDLERLLHASQLVELTLQVTS